MRITEHAKRKTAKIQAVTYDRIPNAETLNSAPLMLSLSMTTTLSNQRSNHLPERLANHENNLLHASEFRQNQRSIETEIFPRKWEFFTVLLDSCFVPLVILYFGCWLQDIVYRDHDRYHAC